MGTAIAIDLRGASFSETIDAAKASQDWAWVSLYELIARPLIGFFRARGAADAADLTGDVFFDVARSISRFSGDESEFRTFVFTIAIRRLEESLAGPAHRRSVLADDVLARLKSGLSPVPDDEDQLIPTAVRDGFAALSPEQRQILSLRIAAGLSLQETATVVERKVRHVTNIQRRAVHKLQLLGIDAGGSK